MQLVFDFSKPPSKRPRRAENTDPVVRPNWQQQRQQRGRVADLAGRAAEESVERHYQQLGYQVAHRRWRGQSGEIDLIFTRDGTYVFVEVKKSHSFSAAADRFTMQQGMRVLRSAEEYLAHAPAGTLTDTRFDLALVNATGVVERRENAFGHF